ncbi:MAG: hypothetical protein M3347_17750 [Armatimonadota bacterium]|nr:hypothetical protein [Armatimonadota bacterium]
MKPQPAKMRILGQPSWRLASDEVEAYVTEIGGHLGPVTFDRQKRRIQPYSVAPWAEEKLGPEIPPILKALRGDFFCLPFGGNEKPFRGERHLPHGESANARWKFESLERVGERTCLHLSLNTQVRPGHIDKRISLVAGHNAVYSQHIISGMSGPMNLGHHATLRFPDEPGSGVISSSPFVYGQVFVEPTELPEKRGYSMLEPGAEFDTLERVPTITGEETDLSRYPARRGFEDIAMIVADAAQPFAWTAVTFPRQRFVWFALKDPRVLRETVFWLSNGGRHYPPWNGRHVNVMGLEEVTAYFHHGLAESARPNPLTEKGFPTTVRLHPQQPLVVNYIMAVATIPAGFDRVAAIEPNEDKNAVVLRASSGKTVRTALDVSFIHNAS